MVKYSSGLRCKYNNRLQNLRNKRLHTSLRMKIKVKPFNINTIINKQKEVLTHVFRYNPSISNYSSNHKDGEHEEIAFGTLVNKLAKRKDISNLREAVFQLFLVPSGDCYKCPSNENWMMLKNAKQFILVLVQKNGGRLKPTSIITIKRMCTSHYEQNPKIQKAQDLFFENLRTAINEVKK